MNHVATVVVVAVVVVAVDGVWSRSKCEWV